MFDFPNNLINRTFSAPVSSDNRRATVPPAEGKKHTKIRLFREKNKQKGFWPRYGLISGDSRINIERRKMKEMTSCEIRMDVLTKTINWSYNWKHPGSDGTQGYWHKKLTSTHTHLLQDISYWLNDPDRLPKFLTQRTIYLQPKIKTSEDPSHYRSIKCSQTLYAK
jgi:hypothetical protein